MIVAVIGSRDYWKHWLQFAPEGLQDLGRNTWAEAHGEANVGFHLLRELKDVPDVMVISGGARGPDKWGIRAARRAGYPTEEFEAQWRNERGNYNRAAGLERNTVLAERADWVIAFWDGKSRGTMDTVRKAHDQGKRVTVIRPDGRIKDNGVRAHRDQPAG